MRNSPGESTIFSIGLYALARYPTQPLTRLHTLWRGPFHVKLMHNSDYALFDMITKKIPMHSCFKRDPKYTDSLVATTRNSLSNLSLSVRVTADVGLL